MERFEWTEKTLAEIKQLWMDGYSGSQIARMYGTNRNVIGGKMWREGMPPRDERGRCNSATIRRKKKAKPAPKTQPKAAARPKPEPKPATKLSGLRPRQPTPLPVVMEHPTNPPLKNIHELGPRDCRWSPPEMHPRDPGFGFCGRPTVSGEAWCAEHYYRVYNKPRKTPETDSMEEAA